MTFCALTFISYLFTFSFIGIYATMKKWGKLIMPIIFYHHQCHNRCNRLASSSCLLVVYNTAFDFVAPSQVTIHERRRNRNEFAFRNEEWNTVQHWYATSNIILVSSAAITNRLSLYCSSQTRETTIMNASIDALRNTPYCEQIKVWNAFFSCSHLCIS